MAAEDEFVPEEIEGECTQCHKALTTVDRLLKPAMAVNKSKLEENVNTVLYCVESCTYPRLRACIRTSSLVHYCLGTILLL